MNRFIKRLAANELGATGGHQKGGILIPKGCVSFFPPLTGMSNPEAMISARFGAAVSSALRVIYYSEGTRNEYRLTPVPHDVIRNAVAGDIFVLDGPDTKGEYVGQVVKHGEAEYDALARRLGNAAGLVAVTE